MKKWNIKGEIVSRRWYETKIKRAIQNLYDDLNLEIIFLLSTFKVTSTSL